jgi:hypothetical protein
MFLNLQQNYKLAHGSDTKDSIQVVARRKDIIYDALPYPGIGKLRWVSDGRLAPGKTV